MEQLEFGENKSTLFLAQISETIVSASNACSDAIALAYWPEQIIINGTFLICTQQILPDIPNLSPNPGCFIISTEYLSLWMLVVEVTRSGIRSKFALSRITRILEKLGFGVFTINRFWNKYKSPTPSVQSMQTFSTSYASGRSQFALTLSPDSGETNIQFRFFSIYSSISSTPLVGRDENTHSLPHMSKDPDKLFRLIFHTAETPKMH